MSLDAVILNEVKKLSAKAGGSAPVNTMQAFANRGEQFTDKEGGEWLRTGVLLDDTAGNYPKANKYQEITGLENPTEVATISTSSSDAQIAFRVTDGYALSVRSGSNSNLRSTSLIKSNVKSTGKDLTEGLESLTGTPYGISIVYDRNNRRYSGALYDSSKRAIVVYDEFFNILDKKEESLTSGLNKPYKFWYDEYSECYWETRNVSTSDNALCQWTDSLDFIGIIDRYDDRLVEQGAHIAVSKDKFLVAQTYAIYIQNKLDQTVYTKLLDIGSLNMGTFNNIFMDDEYLYGAVFKSPNSKIIKIKIVRTDTNFIGTDLPKYDNNGLPLYIKIK